MYSPGKKLRHSPEQIKHLESFYECNPKPNPATIANISSITKLQVRSVQIWFQNRRAKAKNDNENKDKNKEQTSKNEIVKRKRVFSVDDLLAKDDYETNKQKDMRRDSTHSLSSDDNNNQIVNSNLKCNFSENDSSKTENLVYVKTHCSIDFLLS
ncbi:homeobox-domain-containing protein [Neoconidiobolus thromboides FSU 785]|nr:homeobox-domain-containing protein [Neoconidiobolus thromboides FSU 785]